MSWSFSLSVREVADLARFAGLTVTGEPEDEDELDASITIASCPDEGVRGDDETVSSHYDWVAYFSEYPEEGVYPLGKEHSA